MAGDDKKPPQPGHEATILIPGGGLAGSGLSGTGLPSGTSSPGSNPGGSTGFAAGSAASYRPIQPGDVLNHIFEVKRFIARGGMGEVFEGINVNTDERVAIKVILPHLAADPNVQAMFRKEARTLTRLGHPALVQYRVLAQEPQLGVFYIVTDFVDGTNLANVMGQLEATPQDLVNLIRRLASGLQAAHALGAIHRDMAPDNIMLEGGVLSGARIIDFGIAKDLDPGSATIVGTGFAGKLNYVAPEQLGDFGREVGPWTDIYSLALVILAIAGRKDVDMGTTMVNAVDKRRAGPDLSIAPEELRPLLAQMLKPDPKERVRSMNELLGILPSIGSGQTLLQPAAAPADVSPPGATELQPPPSEMPEAVETPEPETTALDEPIEPETPIEAEPPAAWEPPTSTNMPSAFDPAGSEPEPAPVAAKPIHAAHSVPAKSGKSALPLILGGGVAVLLIAAGAWYMLYGKAGSSASSSDGAQVVAVGDQTGPTRAALTAALPSVGCTWLDIADVTQKGDGTIVALRGVAGRPTEAQGQIVSMLAAKNLKSTIDMRDVATIEASECGPLDALRQIRDPANGPGGGRMGVEQRQIEMTKLTSGNLAGTVGATAVVDFNLGDPSQEMSLFGVQPSGKISQLTTERAELVGAATDMGAGRYRLPIDVDHTGWSGLLLLTGQKPFDASLLDGPAGSRTGDWSQRFIAAAQERGWKAEMVWFNAVNEQPD